MARTPFAVAPTAIDDGLAQVHVFISYASEDVRLAQAIEAGLRNTFPTGTFKMSLASDLKIGSHWRTELEAALKQADVLVIVATGRSKPSHSYTGFEVGFFSASKLVHEKMKHFPTQERLIIPIGVLTNIPDVLADIQGLNLTSELTPYLLEEDTLKNPDEFLASIATKPEKNPFYSLFKRLQNVIESRRRYEDSVLEELRKRAAESATDVYKIFFEDFQNRVFTERFPERKIIVRYPDVAIETLGEDLPQETTLEFIGGTFDIFNINPPPDKPTSWQISWQKFIDQIRHDATSKEWTDIIKSLVISAKHKDLADNRRLLTSSDGRRFFRLFISRSIVYYSKRTELHIDVVEVKPRDYGSPKTTMLLKAIQVGLIYRSLFLEGPSSDFSPQTIRSTLPEDLPNAVRKILDELEYVLWMSTDAGLRKAQNINLIYPDWARGELEKRLRQWEQLKSELTNSGYKVLTAKGEALETAKTEFEDWLAAFCSATIPMNEEFLNNVLRLLQDVVKKNGG